MIFNPKKYDLCKVNNFLYLVYRKLADTASFVLQELCQTIGTGKSYYLQFILLTAVMILKITYKGFQN